MRSNTMRRMIALVLSMILPLAQISHAAVYAPEISFGERPRRMDFSSLALPEDLGRIETLSFKNEKRPFVFLIQDAHAIVPAQLKIQEILQFLAENYGVSLVAIEGGEGKLDPLLWRTFPDSFIKEKVLGQYLERGELAASEMAAILNPHEMEYFGIEDWKIYQENYQAYLEAIRTRPILLKALRELEAEKEKKRQRVYSESLSRLHEAVEAFYQERSHLVQLIKAVKDLIPQRADFERTYPQLTQLVRLVSLTDKERGNAIERELRNLGLSFKRHYAHKLSLPDQRVFNRCFQDFQTGAKAPSDFLQTLVRLGNTTGVRFRLSLELKSLFDHTVVLGGLKGTQLMGELERFLNELRMRLVQTAEEQKLSDWFERKHLIEALIKVELTPEQYRIFQSDPETYGGIFPSKELREKLGAALRFYELAVERDKRLGVKLLQLMEMKNASRVAVIAGGFHTKGLRGKLEARDFSYAVITPHIASLEGHERYEKVMRGELSYLPYLKTTYYDAFAMASLIQFAKYIEPSNFGRILKRWRDAILLSLARQKRLDEASRYLGYIDRLTKIYQQKFEIMPSAVLDRSRLLQNLKKELMAIEPDIKEALMAKLRQPLQEMIQRLKTVISEGEDTEQEIKRVLQKFALQHFTLALPRVALIPDLPSEISAAGPESSGTRRAESRASEEEKPTPNAGDQGEAGRIRHTLSRWQNAVRQVLRQGEVNRTDLIEAVSQEKKRLEQLKAALEDLKGENVSIISSIPMLDVPKPVKLLHRIVGKNILAHPYSPSEVKIERYSLFLDSLDELLNDQDWILENLIKELELLARSRNYSWDDIQESLKLLAPPLSADTIDFTALFSEVLAIVKRWGVENSLTEILEDIRRRLSPHRAELRSNQDPFTDLHTKLKKRRFKTSRELGFQLREYPWYPFQQQFEQFEVITENKETAGVMNIAFKRLKQNGSSRPVVELGMDIFPPFQRQGISRAVVQTLKEILPSDIALLMEVTNRETLQPIEGFIVNDVIFPQKGKESVTAFEKGKRQLENDVLQKGLAGNPLVEFQRAMRLTGLLRDWVRDSVGKDSIEIPFDAIAQTPLGKLAAAYGDSHKVTLPKEGLIRIVSFRSKDETQGRTVRSETRHMSQDMSERVIQAVGKRPGSVEEIINDWVTQQVEKRSKEIILALLKLLSAALKNQNLVLWIESEAFPAVINAVLRSFGIMPDSNIPSEIVKRLRQRTFETVQGLNGIEDERMTAIFNQLAKIPPQQLASFERALDRALQRAVKEAKGFLVFEMPESEDAVQQLQKVIKDLSGTGQLAGYMGILYSNRAPVKKEWQEIGVPLVFFASEKNQKVLQTIRGQAKILDKRPSYYLTSEHLLPSLKGELAIFTQLDDIPNAAGKRIALKASLLVLVEMQKALQGISKQQVTADVIRELLGRLNFIFRQNSNSFYMEDGVIRLDVKELLEDIAAYREIAIAA